MSDANAPNLPSPTVTGRLPALLNGALLCAGAVVLLSYAAVALGHLRDRYQVNFVSGVYAGLAARLNEGTLYPDLYDGRHYGGTRYMPLQFVLYAGVARLTGEYLVSGKALTYALTALLCVELFLILRRIGCSRGVALALTSLVLLNEPGLLAATTIRGDLLPVVCQLAAVLVAAGPLSLRRAALAGAFCALAVLSKQSAVWAPLAILCFHLRERRAVALFTVTWLGGVGAAVALVNALSQGRMLANLTQLSVSGGDDFYFLLSPFILLWRVARGGALLAALVPLLGVECIAARKQRRLSLYHYCLLACLLVVLLVYTDKEANMNHLLDLVATAIPVAGCLWVALPEPGRGASGGLRLGLGAAVLWLVYMGWATTLVMPVYEVARIVRSGRTPSDYAVKPLAGLVADDAPILCEDPWVALARGQTPVVLDPYSLGRMSLHHPQLTGDLERRIEARDFTQIVLCQRLDDTNPYDRRAWEDRHFGRPLVRAMRENYRLQARAEGYFVYVPKEDGGQRAER
jgi:hypothetical protein